jgi:hypothetical protein
MRRSLSIFIAVLVLGTIPLLADGATTPRFAQQQLEKLLSNLKLLNSHVHRSDQARVNIIVHTAMAARQSLAERGGAHRTTQNHYQLLMLRLKYAQDFFEFVRSDRNQQMIREILSFRDSTAREFGFDVEPYSFIIEDNVRLLDEALKTIALQQGEAVEQARPLIDEIRPFLLRVLAQASVGDRRLAFNTALELHSKVSALVPVLLTITDGSSAQIVAQEAIALNDFLGAYVQAGRE